MEFYENKVEAERAVLISVDTGEFDVDSSLAELTELAKTAGAEVICEMTQKREAPEPGTYLGRGKLEELSEFCENEKPDLVIVDGELSPAQQKNIETITDVRVIDRTTLILDIFAGRALSGEGKLQVELAQLKYALPRLGGKGASMSRLGGGIGTRGPGETKLETDRRHIRRRISALTEDLKALDERRTRHRERRKKDGVVTVALVGYTNAGKSTLMNTLTDAGVLAENKLFATLDPTARALTLPDGNSVLLIDTVGFIRRLPHKLVEAFKSTLDEAVDANVILNICDASSDECSEHYRVTNELLEELGCGDKPTITVLNKCDLTNDISIPLVGNVVRVSAKTGEGLPLLLEKIATALPPTRKRVKILLPFSMGGAGAELRKTGVVHSEEYTADGLLLDITAEIFVLEKYEEYII
ncbi:MAG: GTPase HflX [Ruminococcaceae bacterium]|nr:GTPase HflX [Oscillospiraceae bacterium]